MNIFAFYNNKGGVGKTTLCQNAAAMYAEQHPETQVIVIDLCPQANVSQFLLGGGEKGYKTNQKLQSQSTRRNIVGFMDMLLKGNSNFNKIKGSYKVKVNDFNKYIASNLYLIAGDSFLESLSLALNYAVINPANQQAWLEYMTAIRRLCKEEFDSEEYAGLVVFIDCNPSFSIYTQMGLASSDNLVIPMMADYSSLEGIKGLMMLLYGHYPSSALKKYATNILTFTKQVELFDLKLPVLYEFAFNNFTSNMGVATAYDSVRNELVDFCRRQQKKFPHIFADVGGTLSSSVWDNTYMSNIKDFHTAGKVSATLGIPMYKLPAKANYTMPDNRSVNLPKRNYMEALNHLNSFVKKLS